MKFPTLQPAALCRHLEAANWRRSASQEIAACGAMGLAAALRASICTAAAAGPPNEDVTHMLAWALRSQLQGMNSGAPWQTISSN